MGSLIRRLNSVFRRGAGAAHRPRTFVFLGAFALANMYLIFHSRPLSGAATSSSDALLLLPIDSGGRKMDPAESTAAAGGGEEVDDGDKEPLLKKWKVGGGGEAREGRVGHLSGGQFGDIGFIRAAAAASKGPHKKVSSPATALLDMVLEPLKKSAGGDKAEGGHQKGTHRHQQHDAMPPSSTDGSSGFAPGFFTADVGKRRTPHDDRSPRPDFEDFETLPVAPVDKKSDFADFEDVPPRVQEADSTSARPAVKSVIRGVIPVQQNPWVDSDKKGDPLADYQYESMSTGGCGYRLFGNHSVYSKPEFVDEYNAYKVCAKKGEGMEGLARWLSDRIHAETGPWRELRLETSFTYDRETSRPLCSADEGGDPPPDMLYAVISRSGRASRRAVVRRTWGTKLPRGHRVVFFVGRDGEASKQQQELHGDVVKTEVDEGDPLFEHKQLAAVLGWVYGRCELTRFVTVTTDSTFVNVRRFEMFLQMEMSSANRLYGNLLKRMEPDRSPSGEHSLPEEEWPWQNLPSFLQGPTFIVSGDVVPRLLVGAKFASPMPLSQVFFTGLVPLVNRVMRIGVAEFFKTELPEHEEECSWARHGAIEGVSDAELMMKVSADVNEVQVSRNITCTIKNTCLAKVDGKCIAKRSDDDDGAKKKKKKDKGKKEKKKFLPWP